MPGSFSSGVTRGEIEYEETRIAAELRGGNATEQLIRRRCDTVEWERKGADGTLGRRPLR